jgi:restriction system protein
MKFLDAAYEILKQAGQPLHYREITRRALGQGLIESKGKTPEATMNAQLAVNIKRAEEGGPPSPFVRGGRGVFGLREWGETMPTTPTTDEQPQPSYLSYKEAALRVLREVGQSLSAQDITQRAIKQGLINPQGLTPDTTNVQRPAVSQLRGDMALLDVDQGMIITTGDFSHGAKDMARVRNVAPTTLIDGGRLTDLLIEYDIGVRREKVEVLSFDDHSAHAETWHLG